MATARRARPTADEIPGAESFLPTKVTLPTLRDAVHTCRGCTLYREATQAVFGESREEKPEPGRGQIYRVVFIGEQPGNSEDLAGKPFVGPSGKLLDEALEASGIPLTEAYVTNVVKHFKFERRGKRRIHDKPTRYEIRACKPWLGAELATIQPSIVVLLGATAAQALLGNDFRVTKSRGHALETDLARWTFATVHPASVLRAPDADARKAAREAFFADLALVGHYYRKL